VSSGLEQEVPLPLTSWLPGLPRHWCEHDSITVNGQEVDWWVSRDGSPHACTVDGLARALAWSIRRWDRRHVIAAMLANPERQPELAAEAALEG
jgi:hypothetical protein